MLASARCAGDQRFDDLADDALLRFGQCIDALELLLQLGRRAALLRGTAVVSDQGFDADAQGLSDDRKHRDLNAAVADFVGGDGLLRNVERFGELDLGDALFFPQLRDASAEPSEEGAVVVGDGHAGRVNLPGFCRQCLP